MIGKRLKELSREIARELAGDFEIQQMVREVVLLTLIQQEEIRNSGLVRAFFRECQARHVTIRLDAEGKIMVKNHDAMGADLRAVMTCYREPIVRHLESIRDAEEAMKRRASQGK